MGIEPTAGGCPATGFEVQERHQAANYSRIDEKPFLKGFQLIITFSLVLFKSKNIDTEKTLPRG